MATGTTTSKTKADEVKAPETAPQEQVAEGEKNLEVVDRPTKEYVRYYPPEGFSVRIITVSDWRNLGIEQVSRSEWNETNDFRLPTENFNEDQLDYLEFKDNGFAIVEE